MDQHPIPRQITTFEFKLIGFLTLRQFIYLIVFLPIGFVAYRIFPIPILNIIIGLLVSGIGAAFAFLPINERPLDVWIKNFYKRLTSPTQYFYQKSNRPLYFLNNLYFLADPHRVVSHIESQEKLAAYLVKNRPPQNQKKQNINSLLQQSILHLKKTNGVTHEKPLTASSGPQQNPLPVMPKTENPETQRSIVTPSPIQKPYFTGVIKNHKLIPLPGILIYVKNEKGEPLRLLKTNPHGVFATFSRLPVGEYVFEVKDPKNSYFFDTMKIAIGESNSRPLEFFSKELL